MKSIEVAVLNPEVIPSAEKMMVCAARLTQRGHKIKSLDDFMALYLASDRNTRTELQPSATLIRSLKQRKGFTNATRNNIRVYRCVAGYTIEMAGRNGAKAKSELIRLPGTK